MEIKVKISNAAQDYVDQNDVLWKLQTKKNSRIYILLIIGVASFIFGLFDNSTVFGTRLLMDFGIILIIVSIMILYTISVQKTHFKTAVLITARKYHQENNEALIEINPNFIKFTDYQLTKEMKWGMFSSYTIFENYIFISQNLLNSSVILDKRLISENEYSELISFLKSKFILKEY